MTDYVEMARELIVISEKSGPRRNLQQNADAHHSIDVHVDETT
jgi:hypothetical protein